MPKPFTKGDIRINRKGRPKRGDSLIDILEYELDRSKKIIKDGKETTVLYRHLIIRKLVELAEKGDIQALKYICDRTLGTPHQTLDATIVDVEVKFLDDDDC
ncbi:MAG: hypothetical protein Ta2B_08030 [Termitinemataceae bacterium]|nr:MAG: hypothetical protein Ta2B_08030 [Termitinemataceae bacterium]